ncbi:TPA: CHAP domain-containing protein [Staphylococcus aureus]|nr:CHAP domain-containing protein [Staphylococcus aureus]HDH6271417.1 CHAP domain-containing protein [Staphylococcus aureus LTCF-4-25]HDI6795412.1 CHAP domain-containing protein [Staphylococcus aureus]HDI6835082.1 CHAP domain-containing protein [Staphylococcus aureus]
MKVLALLSSKRVRKILYGIAGAIIIPILALIVLLASFQNQQKEDNEDMETNGSCSVKGGELSDKGKKTFEQNAKGGALEGKAEDLQKIAKKHDVPPTLFVAIVSSESQWGKGANATKQKNPLSVMGAGTIHDSAYPTIDKGLEAGAKNLNELYISKGLTTPEKIGPKYAPTEGATNDPDGMNNAWIPTVKSIMKDLGGEKAKTSCSDSKGSDGKGFDLKGSKFPKPKGAKEYDFNPTYPWGQCTWYVHQRRHQIGKDVPTTLGDGGDWDDAAKSAGFKTGKTPKEGACASLDRGVLGADGAHGHIMFVEKVKSDGSITVSEANVKGLGVISTRDFSKEEAKQINYIYDK